ncbi:MAG: M3 family oligoendopeptidase [Chlorobi bacterium]|nr:M3 family oligoendopeptidase [Chlorobiota bacterium]
MKNSSKINTHLIRKYLPENLEIDSWQSIKKYFDELLETNLDSLEELQNWLHKKSELESVLEENLAWRYIKMNCNTEDKSIAESFNHFVTNIEPRITKNSDLLNKKLIQSVVLSELKGKEYFVMLRSVKRKIEMFREENVPIIAELQKIEQEYGTISSNMTIYYNEKELTLQQASNYLKSTNRKVRKKVYELISARRNEEIERFDNLLSRLIEKRNLVALNANYKNYRKYKFDDLERFDYTDSDCEEFHESIKSAVVPLVKNIHEYKKQKLGYNELKPYDLDVDSDLKPPLKPFSNSKELISKTLKCFNEINPEFAKFISIMDKNGYLDIESRKGKAPGGFNYPLYESNIPFIFMNATGNLRDVETMVHEGGHAVHSFLTSKLDLVDFKNLPSEVAELASMSMELISMEHWNHFFSNEDDLKRAKQSQLEGIINVLPWIAKIDKFQNWLYEYPKHNFSERKEAWVKIANEYESGIVDWNDYELNYVFQWQKQLHIFEVPFYYIEYGFAQLGAIAIWRNYRKNPVQTLNDYIKALKLGYTVTIPEIYKTAGIEFNFSKKYINELMEFVLEELNALR